MDLSNVHLEQNADELEIYIGGYFLTSVSNEDISDEARAELPAGYYSACPKTEDSKHVTKDGQTCIHCSANITQSGYVNR